MTTKLLTIGEMQSLYVRYRSICKSRAPKSIKRLRLTNFITDIHTLEKAYVRDERLSDLKQAAQEEIEKSWVVKGND